MIGHDDIRPYFEVPFTPCPPQCVQQPLSAAIRIQQGITLITGEGQFMGHAGIVVAAPVFTNGTIAQIHDSIINITPLIYIGRFGVRRLVRVDRFVICGLVGMGRFGIRGLGGMGRFVIRGLVGMGRFGIRGQADSEFARANPCNRSLPAMHGIADPSVPGTVRFLIHRSQPRIGTGRPGVLCQARRACPCHPTPECVLYIAYGRQPCIPPGAGPAHAIRYRRSLSLNSALIPSLTITPL